MQEPSKSPSKITLRRILHYYWIHAKKYPKTGIVSIVSFLIAIPVSGLLPPIIYKNIIDAVSQGPSPENVDTAMYWLALLGCTLFVFFIFYRVGDFCDSYFSSNVQKSLADYAFHEVHKHSYSFFVNRFVGAIVSKTKRYIGGFSILYDTFIWQILASFIQLCGSMVVLLIFAPIIGLLYLVWLVLYISVAVYLTKKKIPYDLAEAEMDSMTIGRFSDATSNALAIKMFSSRKREENSFDKYSSDWERKRRKAYYFMSWQGVILASLYLSLEFIALFSAIYLWSEGSITIGTVVLVQTYVIATFRSVWGVGRALSAIEKALADAKEMVEIFEEEPDVRDPEKPEICRISRGHIEFREVSFSYEKDQTDVFRDFSLAIAPGEKVGLVGESGAGKTTITKILLRFSDISQGAVLIDGQDIRNIRQDDLRANISYVPQEPVLFHRSLRENIAYGRPDASEEEVIEAARRAHAHEFIEKLPNGYDTLVGERGVKLSGGERQRVAIARAMLKDAPILILDEATSSLDSVSERHIQAALDALMQGKTTIVVAHRLSTIQKMDRILVMENGEIAEEGSHEELLAKRGVYATFWNEQVGGFLGNT